MSPAAEHLRARIAAAPTQRAGRRRYGTELRRALVEYAFAREGERATIREIAEELGLSAGVLGRWLRRARLRLKKGRGPFEVHALGMNPAAEHLRARIAVVLKQDGGGRRYGTELKREVVEHAFARKGERATSREIAEELGLSTGLLYKWLRHARLRLDTGKTPFEPGEPPPMPWRDEQEPAAASSGAGSTPSCAEPVKAGSVPFSVRSANDPPSGDGMPRRRGATAEPIVIPATTLAGFLARAVARHGSLRRAADGIGVPYSTLRGWLQGRGDDVGDQGDAFIDTVKALRGDLEATKQHLTVLLGDVNAMSERLDALERMLGRESDVRPQA